MTRLNEIWRLPPLHWVVLAGGGYLLQSYTDPSGLLPPWARSLGMGVLALGALFVLIAVAQLVIKRTNVHAFRDPEKLVTSGMFAYSRNPIYLGLTLMLTGVGLYWNTTLSLWPAVLFFLLANFWYAPSEEKAAERVFGEKYTAYRKKVRRWL